MDGFVEFDHDHHLVVVVVVVVCTVCKKDAVRCWVNVGCVKQCVILETVGR